MSPHETGSAPPMAEGPATEGPVAGGPVAGGPVAGGPVAGGPVAEGPVVEGSCDLGFTPVRNAFRGNFRDRGEIGGAVCVMVDGRIVVDLRGGWADPDRGRRWRPDTLVNMFSVGKGLIAACAARLAGQGRLDPDAAVASYWPEFGAADRKSVV